MSKTTNSETYDKLVPKKPPLGEIVTDHGFFKLQYQEISDDNNKDKKLNIENGTESNDKGKPVATDKEDNSNDKKDIERQLSLISLKPKYTTANNNTKKLDSKYMIVPKESILNSTKCSIKPHKHILYF
ncbi:unnamed protein product [[Candida] boidinii]|nr:unnamed protein product [[Candida] boidinii]